ncbi:MAG: DUF4281 domain-containing protein [Planctomycetia bacterium]|nr:DUF4281 domain-containing protein [Planctomycetia bacterium]
MDLEILFTIANALVLPGWALLVLAPGWRVGTHLLAPLLVPALLALLYVFLMVTGFTTAEGGGFNSLAGVKALFAVDRLLFAGWVHYLAFDLFIGSWVVRDARRLGIHHLLVIPCLALTFLAGPVGLGLYFVLRMGIARRMWIDDGVPAPATVET